jgi:transposase
LMIVEHIDDLPLLGDLMQQTELSSLLDASFPDHGHWKGISGGKLAVGWLLYLLSESDHRLSHVEEWSEQRLHTLSVLLDEPSLRSLDFNDDRLGCLLDRYSNDQSWESFEGGLGKNIIEVYPLNSLEEDQSRDYQVVRSDSFNVPQFKKPGGLFAHGYSKQRRSDQPFCKVMLSALDVLRGSGPDVDHYLSVIKRAQSILNTNGNLYVGDAQLGSTANRASIHLSGDYYLCPLGKKQCSEQEVEEYLSGMPCPIGELPSLFTEPDSKRKLAYYFEVNTTMEVKGKDLE